MENKKGQWVCKPGSVPRSVGTNSKRSRWRPLICARRLPDASIATYPDRSPRRTAASGVATALILFGLAPDGVYRAGRVTPAAGALLPHRFTLTTHTRPVARSRPFGGLLSVALSLASRPVDVIDHPVRWSPDFPPGRHAGVTFPSDRPTHCPPWMIAGLGWGVWFFECNPVPVHWCLHNSTHQPRRGDI